MKISVILCTYNRSSLLPSALESVAASMMPASAEWEVLVVDNNSTDQTKLVFEHAAARHPRRFRYLFEPRPGKSHALNSGIQAASGDVLAFMDDDVTVEPAWLRNLTAPLEVDQWAGVGGRIFLEKDFLPPRWLALRGRYGMGGILAQFDPGDHACELKEPPYGTSMAFRKAIFEKHGGFRTDLGPRPGSEIRSEDTEFGRRVMKAGERLWFEPSAIVYHAVPPSRRERQYFLNWWFDHGRSAIRELSATPGQRPPDIPRIVFGSLPVVARWLLASDPKRRFFCKTRIWLAAGQVAETHRRRHAAV
jgi:glycosyltransferase involved in cell wall biosynthesis